MALDPVFRALLDMPGMQFTTPPPEVTPAMMREIARQSMPPDEPPQIPWQVSELVLACSHLTPPVHYEILARHCSRG